MSPSRVAIVSQDFPLENGPGGGPGVYSAKLARTLREQGHVPEVFTIGANRVTQTEGIRVELVPPLEHLFLRIASRGLRRTPTRCDRLVHRWCAGKALADAVERRHEESPFDIVQCTSYGKEGLFIRKHPNRRLVVRCNTARLLYESVSRGGPLALQDFVEDWLERRVFRRADLVYSPSELVARYLRYRCKVPVEVVQPPFRLDALPDSGGPPVALPTRYVVHVSSNTLYKGTDVLLDAIPQVAAKHADFRVVMLGKSDQYIADGVDSVVAVGKLERSRALRIIEGAVAMVAPSRTDNLPNAVIESLLLGVPVIGTYDSSIEEVVQDGLNGRLVTNGDASALATAICEAWSGTGFWGPLFQLRQPLLQDNCKESIDRLFQLAAISASSRARELQSIGHAEPSPK